MDWTFSFRLRVAVAENLERVGAQTARDVFRTFKCPFVKHAAFQLVECVRVISVKQIRLRIE